MQGSRSKARRPQGTKVIRRSETRTRRAPAQLDVSCSCKLARVYLRGIVSSATRTEEEDCAADAFADAVAASVEVVRVATDLRGQALKASMGKGRARLRQVEAWHQTVAGAVADAEVEPGGGITHQTHGKARYARQPRACTHRSFCHCSLHMHMKTSVRSRAGLHMLLARTAASATACHACLLALRSSSRLIN